MKALDLALNFYRRYSQVEEINNYYGLLANYGLVQVCHETGDEGLLASCRELLMRYPDGITHPYYNFSCYRLGGNAGAWADMVGLQKRRPRELKAFSESTMAGPKEKGGLLCMPGREKEGWIWIDTLTAITPFMLFAGISLGEERYIDFAAEQCFGMYEALLDESCGLLHQCRGFLPEGKCSEDHWSRGNGWGYLALAELIQYLPSDSRHREKAERYYRDLSAALLPWQNDRGFWRQEITERTAWEESSGTALILYGMGIGLRLRLLEPEIYRSAFCKGLEGLLKYASNPDFSTELSCPGCLCPGDGSIHAYLTEKQPQKDEHHSYGAFMLALAEAHRNGITDIPWGCEE